MNRRQFLLASAAALVVAPSAPAAASPSIIAFLKGVASTTHWYVPVTLAEDTGTTALRLYGWDWSTDCVVVDVETLLKMLAKLTQYEWVSPRCLDMVRPVEKDFVPISTLDLGTLYCTKGL
jgi:hypothetical protein